MKFRHTKALPLQKAGVGQAETPVCLGPQQNNCWEAHTSKKGWREQASGLRFFQSHPRHAFPPTVPMKDHPFLKYPLPEGSPFLYRA